MNKYIGQFPLKLILFPGETLNLHIFEERYKELVEDFLQEKIQIGIPPIIKSQGLLCGTLIESILIRQKYQDGKMDITVRGGKVYDIIRYDDPMKNKRYGGAEIQFRSYDAHLDFLLNQEIIELVKSLYNIMGIQKTPHQEDLSFHSFIHKIGLSIGQEYQLLQMESGLEQQQFILDHLQALLPVVQEMEKMKKRILMNGHFKQPINQNPD